MTTPTPEAPPIDEALAPACMKCEQVTGKTTCFPSRCVFYHERNTPGTKAHSVATLDRVRRGMRAPVFASASTIRQRLGGSNAENSQPGTGDDHG